MIVIQLLAIKGCCINPMLVSFASFPGSVRGGYSPENLLQHEQSDCNSESFSGACFVCGFPAR